MVGRHGMIVPLYDQSNGRDTYTSAFGRDSIRAYYIGAGLPHRRYFQQKLPKPPKLLVSF